MLTQIHFIGNKLKDVLLEKQFRSQKKDHDLFLIHVSSVADPKLLISNLDLDPTLRVVSYSDPTWRVISDLDPAWQVISNPAWQVISDPAWQVISDPDPCL
jgi:hypothetical protein